MKPATLLAVGDVASCDSEADERVAALVARTAGTVALLGDIAYENGTEAEFRNCFLPRWGSFLRRTRAALGNHEYANGRSAAEAARSVFDLTRRTWYSYRLGAWRVLVLDSNCAEVGGCDRGAPQWVWLRNELRRYRATRCVLAYWHHPRFSSGDHGSDSTYAPFWDLLAAAKADVVLAGHDHDYERFAPAKGIRSFVVGTGGKSLRGFGEVRPRSVVRWNESYGVLRLTLHATSYDWRFLTAAGEPFTDAGSARCR